jgi:hypothetical protein
MKRPCCLIIFITCLSLSVFSQQTASVQPAGDYTRVITQRAEKIVVSLHITIPAAEDSVRNIIIQQYRNLSRIHDEHTTQVKTIRSQKTVDKPVDETAITQVEAARMTQLKKVHDEYLAKLAGLLSPQQIDQVKDGMTYGVLPITYKGYQDMILELTDEQKKQIYAWLLEAREYAMDAESSDKKHQWFGKYKGRINNYLSAAGYDLKKAGEDWEKRRKAAAVQGK